MNYFKGKINIKISFIITALYKSLNLRETYKRAVVRTLGHLNIKLSIELCLQPQNLKTFWQSYLLW